MDGQEGGLSLVNCNDLSGQKGSLYTRGAFRASFFLTLLESLPMTLVCASLSSN